MTRAGRLAVSVSYGTLAVMGFLGLMMRAPASTDVTRIDPPECRVSVDGETLSLAERTACRLGPGYAVTLSPDGTISVAFGS